MFVVPAIAKVQTEYQETYLKWVPLMDPTEYVLLTPLTLIISAPNKDLSNQENTNFQFLDTHLVVVILQL